MKELLPFLMAHWPLSLAFVLTLLAIVFLELRDRQSGGKRIGSSELTHLVNHKNAQILDIRESADFIQGHIISSINVTEKTLEDHLGKLRKQSSRPIILVDNNGSSAGSMLKILTKEGLDVHVLAGGLAAWREEGLPLTTINE